MDCVDSWQDRSHIKYKVTGRYISSKWDDSKVGHDSSKGQCFKRIDEDFMSIVIMLQEDWY